MHSSAKAAVRQNHLPVLNIATLALLTASFYVLPGGACAETHVGVVSAFAAFSVMLAAMAGRSGSGSA